MEPGDLIMRISATDVDEGDNARITYDLSPAPSGSPPGVSVEGDIEYFKWDWKTGEVKLNKKLDKPINYVFQLQATASDAGSPPRRSTIHVTLEVKYRRRVARKWHTPNPNTSSSTVN